MEPKKSELREIPVDRIKRGRWQARRLFDTTTLAELADSIEAQGVIQPIIVRLDKVDGLYEIIAGERRWRAAQLALQHAVPVVTKDVSIAQATEMSLVENIQRDNLNPIEEAEAIAQLMKVSNFNQPQVAAATGKSRPHITSMLNLLNLAAPVQQLLIEGKLKIGHAKPLIPLIPTVQVMLAEMAVRNRWSVRVVESRAAEHLVGTGQRDTQDPVRRDPNLVRLENDLQDRYGMPCQIEFNHHSGHGTLKIKFKGAEELQGLLENWGWKSDDLTT